MLKPFLNSPLQGVVRIAAHFIRTLDDDDRNVLIILAYSLWTVPWVVRARQSIPRCDRPLALCQIHLSRAPLGLQDIPIAVESSRDALWLLGKEPFTKLLGSRLEFRASLVDQVGVFLVVRLVAESVRMVDVGMP